MSLKTAKKRRFIIYMENLPDTLSKETKFLKNKSFFKITLFNKSQIESVIVVSRGWGRGSG